MLLDRYRIVALLGRGGMGEVYRAEDLKLGQAVALKFLPSKISDDPDALERFRREVRITRQVSHPHVCRVFDVGEADGQIFLSMEFIDGEDLRSLLRRIGRLPADKALEVARQLCAGLAAAHQMGILHRDLKPANVMIDGRGRVRIMDFGLAVLGGDAPGAEARAGTPGYMAPEQAGAKGTSIRSDIYSLGLLLYELFTGKRAFEAGSIAELLRRQQENAFAPPSSLVQDLNPVVERVILRCLETEPRSRPGSALEVARALPGGDPLAAALAAGETPSPEMVAAAGETEGLHPAIAWSCVLVLIAGIAFALWPEAPLYLVRHVPMEKPPAVLAERAQSMVRELGYSATPADTYHDFDTNSDFLGYIAKWEPVSTRWNHEIGPIHYFFRSSSQPIYTYDFFKSLPSEHAPPLDHTGDAMLRLSPKGRLLKLIIVPAQTVKAQENDAPAAVDWSPLFREAGLDAAHWTAAAPEWTPPVYADTRAAWTGVVDEFPQTPMRVEAAAFRGRPVYFELITPWTRAERMQPYQPSPGDRAAGIFFTIVLLLLVVGGGLLARRNLRAGRGDRRGAWRLAALIFVIGTFRATFSYHVSDFSEIGLLMMRTAWALFFSAFLWMLYLALEPLVRRKWPRVLVSWSRLLAGGLRDPLVGRDILFGLAGAGIFQLASVIWLVAYRMGKVPENPPFTIYEWELLGGRYELAGMADSLMGAIFFSCAILFLLFLLRLLLRRDWAVVPVWTAVLATVVAAENDFHPVRVATLVVAWLVLVLLTLRFGLLALTVMFFVSRLLVLPLTPDVSAWYFNVGAVALLVVAALTAFAFHTSLGGKPAFGKLQIDD